MFAAVPSAQPPLLQQSHAARLSRQQLAKVRVREGGPGARHTAYEWVRLAMTLFEEAERQRAPGNDDALLRWNACMRFLERHPELAPQPEERTEPVMSE